VTPQPERLVLLGHPLSHSLSPVLHNAALSAAGIRARYEALDVPPSALEAALEELRRDRAAGNVTIPYKERVYGACDRLTDAARAVGAVNTFWTAVDGARVGDNTDVPGFNAAVTRLTGGPSPREVVAILGAGGGAAAVLRAMEGWPAAGARLYSRTRSRAEMLVQRFRVPCEIVATADSAVAGATLVVNATPVGLRDDSVPVSVDALPRTAAVLDLAYRRDETPFVRQARARGLKASDGLTMLVEQAALAFELWFGVVPDRQVMWAAIGVQR